ncbi:MAG: FkbM family methyltransferase [Bacteroidota bacterium]
MSRAVKRYLRKIKLFSTSERLYIILYSVCSIILNKLPKNVILTYDVYKKTLEHGYIIQKNGSKDLVKLEVNNVTVRVLLKRNSSDALVLKQIFLDQEYFAIISLANERNISCNTIIDAGANVGLTSIYFSKYFPNASIIALEPNKNTYQRLVENIKLNNSKNIITIEEGIWSTNTFLRGDYSFRDHNDWSFSLKETNTRTNDAIKCTTLDVLIEKSSWDTVDLLKIDIEGGEDAVFNTVDEVKGWLPKVKIVAVEIHNEFNCRDRIYNILTYYNFGIKETTEGLTIATNNNLI